MSFNKILETRNREFVKWILDEYHSVGCVATACRYFDVDVVRRLLENGSDVNASDCFGKTPLAMAVCKRDQVLVELILRYKPDINAVDALGMDALRIAYRLGAYDIVRQLLEVDRIDVDGLIDSASMRFDQKTIRSVIHRWKIRTWRTIERCRLLGFYV